MTNSAILVTGGAGYIGSHICKALSTAGYAPVVFDNLEHGHRWAVKWGPLVEGDIRDPAAIHAAIAEHKPTAVIHLAAYCYVGESVTDPAKYYENNVVGSFNLAQAMTSAGVEHLVFSSSCAVYGVPEHLPITEDSPTDPINPYGRTKLITEMMLSDLALADRLRSVSLRYFNASGADPQNEIGEVHVPETHLIPLAIEAALGRSTGFTIFGDDYPTRDGTCIRDYVHVTDLAEAHVLALKYLEGGGETTQVNLGTETGNSNLEVVEAIRDVVGSKFEAATGARRPGDPAELFANSSKAGSLLNWSPRYTDIRDHIEHAVRWHSRNDWQELLSN